MQKEETITGNLSLASRRARSINHIQGKNLPSKFCATAREARGSCSSRALDRELGEGGIVVIAKQSGHEGKRKGRKAREALLGVIVVYRFSKSFYPLVLSFVPLPSVRDFFLPISFVYLFRCLFVSFGTKNIVYAAVGV